MTVPDRVVGCVLGLALGDATGAPFEGRRAYEVPDPIPALELPWRGGPPGSTTDDTAMARNLVRSLGARGRFDPDDLIERHVAWFGTNPPGVGTVTRLVLSRVAAAERAFEASRIVWEERGPEVSAGNGSVMYCAPLGAAYAHRSDDLVELAPLLSRLTHHDERCRTACLAVAVATAALIRGEPPERSLHEAVTRSLQLDGGEELEFLIDAVGSVRPVDGPDMGFCLFTAAIGLRSIVLKTSFEEAIRGVVALGGDTDTNAAVGGALLGARDGASSLPSDWLTRLIDRERIEGEARDLVALAARS